MEESSTTYHGPLEDRKNGLGINLRKAKITFSIDNVHKAKVKNESGRKNSEKSTPRGIIRPVRVMKLGRNILKRSVRLEKKAKKTCIKEDQEG